MSSKHHVDAAARAACPHEGHAAPSPPIRYHRVMSQRAREAGHGEEYRLEGALDFMSLLWGIEHGLQSASKRMEKSLGITGPQRLVLRIVEQFPGLSAKSLARIVHLHPSTI